MNELLSNLMTTAFDFGDGVKLISILSAVLFCVCLPAFAQKITVKEALRTELNGVLKAASELHKACVDQDPQKIATSVKNVIAKIDRANKKSVLAENQQTHLVKILNAAKEDLRLSQELSGTKRRDELKEAFFQIVQIVKVYNLDSYPVYFCGKDRSVWLQKGWGKPKNPIHPKKFSNCGQLVR